MFYLASKSSAWPRQYPGLKRTLHLTGEQRRSVHMLVTPHSQGEGLMGMTRRLRTPRCVLTPRPVSPHSNRAFSSRDGKRLRRGFFPSTLVFCADTAQIGLPQDKDKLPLLCILDPFLVGNEVLVTPCVTLHTFQRSRSQRASHKHAQRSRTHPRQHPQGQCPFLPPTIKKKTES